MAVLGESMPARHEGLAIEGLAIEGLAMAVANTAPPGGQAGSVEGSHDLEISPWRTRLRLLVAAGFTMPLLSATLAFDWWDGFGECGTVAGHAGVAALALMTIGLIRMLPTQCGAVAVVNPFGIRDLRIGQEFLPRDSIRKMNAAFQDGAQGFAVQASQDRRWRIAMLQRRMNV